MERDQATHVQILTMNVEENFQIPAELEISSFPALALFRNGEFHRFIGGIVTPDVTGRSVGGIKGEDVCFL